MSAGPGSEAEDRPMPVYIILIYQCPDKFCASYAHDYSTIYSFIYVVVLMINQFNVKQCSMHMYWQFGSYTYILYDKAF